MARWIKGPPPGRGRWWVVWHTLHGQTRIEPIEVGPAFIYGDDPTAPLLFKTLGGIAYQFEPNRDAFSHHMPLVAPLLPEEPRG